MRKSFLSVLLLVALLSALFASCAFAIGLNSFHLSTANLVDGKSTYDNAAFNSVYLDVYSEDSNFTDEYLKATGTLTIDAATYEYIAEDDATSPTSVNNTSKTFKLQAVDGAAVDDEIDYALTDDDGSEIIFVGDKSNTGLNGVSVSWTFSGYPELGGTGSVPEFVATKTQLSTACPYIECIYNGDGNISGFKWRLVKTSDTSKALSLDYESRFNIRYCLTDGTRSKTIKSDIFYAGDTVEGTTTLDAAIASDDLEWIEARVMNRTWKDQNIYPNHRWRFYVAEAPDTDSSSSHSSSSSCSTGLLGLGGAALLLAVYKRKF